MLARFARLWAVYVKFNDWVELARSHEDVKSITPLILLRHEIQVLVLIYNLLSGLVLSHDTIGRH